VKTGFSSINLLFFILSAVWEILLRILSTFTGQHAEFSSADDTVPLPH
jgi:hypothetical protein